jgi:hypothetical protein
MSLVAPIVKSLVSPVVVSLLGGGGGGSSAISAEAALDAALEAEATSGDFVAQPLSDDITAFFKADGSGNPSIGESLDDCTILDTSQFGGKTASAFIAGREELVTNGGFSTDSDWTKNNSATISGGVGNLTATNDALKQDILGLPDGDYVLVCVDLNQTSSGTFRVYVGGVLSWDETYNVSGSSTLKVVLPWGSSTDEFQLRSAGWVGTVDNVSLKHLPGNHTTATGTGPTVAGANTTERGPELVTNGTFDSDISGWASGRSAILTHESDVLRVTNSPSISSGVADWALTTEIGATYEFEATMTASGDGAASGRVNVRTAAGLSGTALFSDDGVSVGETISGTFVATGTTTYMLVGVFAGGVSGYCEFDNISVKKVIQLPVISTNGTDDKLTLPLPARRNLLTWTEDFSNGVWTGLASGATRTGADIQITADNGYGYHRQTYTFTSSQAYAVAVTMVCDQTVSDVGVRFTNAAAVLDHTLVDFVAGVPQTVVLTGTSPGSGGTFEVGIDNRNINSDVPTDEFGYTVTFQKVQFNTGSTATAYQRITSDHLADTSITMAVRTSDTQGYLVNGQGTGKSLGYFFDGSSGTSLSSSAGTPSFRADGADISPSTQDDLHTAVAGDVWRVVTISSIDLSTWTQLVFGFFSASSSANTDYDLAHISIYPDNTATQALAEAAAADAIKATGYALAA